MTWYDILVMHYKWMRDTFCPGPYFVAELNMLWENGGSQACIDKLYVHCFRYFEFRDSIKFVDELFYKKFKTTYRGEPQ